jgi:hypothetical protein
MTKDARNPRIRRWDIDSFILRLTQLRNDAHAVGMHATGQILHDGFDCAWRCGYGWSNPIQTQNEGG